MDSLSKSAAANMRADPPPRLQPDDMLEAIECWDNDDDLQCLDDLQFQTAGGGPGSAATSVTGSVRPSGGHRDSISSRRSDLESNGGDEDWQVLLRESDDAAATEEAIASARTAGIPIPDNVPRSALVGGTIKKIRSKIAKKTLVDDWSEDLDLSGVKGDLALKKRDDQEFPDTLRQDDLEWSPKSKRTVDASPTAKFSIPISSEMKKGLDQTGDDIPTIKVARARSPRKQLAAAFNRDLPGADNDTDDFEKDFELPAGSGLLRLNPRKDVARTPAQKVEDWDVEWAEGSIGVRFGGTKRDDRSTQASSVSALSPSVSSCLTAESEDEGLDGLVLPNEPLDLEKSMRKRAESLHLKPEEERPKPKEEQDGKDFFDDLDIGDGDVFTSNKPTINRNVKRKIAQPTSPVRTSKTITFTNTYKANTGVTRIPRLAGHERAHSNLEPVSESGAPVVRFRRPNSRLSGNSSNPSAASSTHTSPPSTPSRGRLSLDSRFSSRESPRGELTTTSAQLLRSKRSMPAMRTPQQTSTSTSPQWSPSRHDGTIRAAPAVRPKTPVERTSPETRVGTPRRPPVPFLPAGASQSQSHHASVKFPRQYRRSEGDLSGDIASLQKTLSRYSYTGRPPSAPSGQSEAITITSAKRAVTRPTRRRHFGDGTELESFDDLPTSASAESRFMKTPVGHGAPRSVRSRLVQTTGVVGATPSTAPSSTSTTSSFTPRFARETSASRNAREQRSASFSHTRERHFGSHTSGSATVKGTASTASRSGVDAPTTRTKRSRSKTSSSRPQLIRPMGSGVHEPRCKRNQTIILMIKLTSYSKAVKGMRYNPQEWRWEGNEQAIADFDAALPPKSPKATPALITSMGRVQGVQIVDGMVFDPQRMCWFKLAPIQPGGNVMAIVKDDPDDVFAGLEDLDDKPKGRYKRGASYESTGADAAGSGAGGWDEGISGDSSEDWPLTEEFDVGPEFIKRQRTEEDRWRRKVERWVTPERRMFGDEWRWTIRDLVRSDDE